ncbi:MAG: hypothetical protein QM756_42725 [Polyangiaceae bacterium]
MSYTKLSGALLVGILGGFGCAAQDSGSPSGASEDVAVQAATVTDGSGRVVAPTHQMTVGTDHIISFYEPTPGDFFALESKPAGTRSLLDQFTKLDVAKIFATLAPNQAIPEQLRAAELRSLAAEVVATPAALAESRGGAAAVVASAVTGTSGDVAKTSSALTSSSNPAEFVNTGGCDWAANFSACRVNWSGGWFAQANANSAGCTFDLYAGNGVTLQKTRGTSVTNTNWTVGLLGRCCGAETAPCCIGWTS